MLSSNRAYGLLAQVNITGKVKSFAFTITLTIMPTTYYVQLRFDHNTPLSLSIDAPVIVGRAEAQVNLNLYGAERLGVSRQHLELIPTHHNLMIRDLESRNGTVLNGIPLTPLKLYILRSGDRLHLGKLSGELLIARDEFGEAALPQSAPASADVETRYATPLPHRPMEVDHEAVHQAMEIMRAILINKEISEHMMEYIAVQAVRDEAWSENARLAVLRTACSFGYVARDNAELMQEERKRNKLRYGNIE